MKKTREKNKKRDINNIRIIVIAILFLLVLTAIYFLYLRFVPEITIPYEGIGISGKEITETLLSEKEGENIEGIKIEEQSLVYKKLNTYYIGQTKKQKLNINLPIYINKNIAVFNIAQGVKLITNKYEEKDGYPNTTITGGMLYNIQNLERADEEEYIFMKNEDGIYINTKEMKIKTAIKEYQIPLNSIIYFTEEQISYYKIEGDIFKYEKITQIDKDTKVEIGEEITYEELLKKLKIIETEEPQEEIIIEEEQPQEEAKEEKEEAKEENKEEIIVEEPIQEPVEEEPEEEQEEKPEETEEQTQPEQNQDVEIKYQKPQVTCEEFTAKVYSMSTTLMIQDPSGTIKTPIQFIFKKNGKTYFRKGALSSGKIEITGFIPDTEFEIEVYYIYENEEGKKIQKTILEQTIKTMGLDTLNSIGLEYENGEIFNNKIEIKNLKITTDLTDETIKGIKRGEIIVDGVSYKISTEKLNKLIRGESIDYQTQEGIQSNKEIEYTIKFYDTQGNELPLDNAKGKTRTSKQAPSVDIKLKKQDISEVQIQLTLKNKDNVEISNYKYVITRGRRKNCKRRKFRKKSNRNKFI